MSCWDTELYIKTWKTGSHIFVYITAQGLFGSGSSQTFGTGSSGGFSSSGGAFSGGGAGVAATGFGAGTQSSSGN
jgi:uncharacterized membrane protein YgcG